MENYKIPELKEVKLYRVANFRADSNGDYFNDFYLEYKENPTDEEIQDLHALQYNKEVYVKKYQYEKSISVPVVFTTEEEINYFVDEQNTTFNNHQIYNDYFFLVQKLERNRFRSDKSRKTCIKAIQSILDGEPDNNAIEYSTGRMFTKRY
jgi:hypothetical protein